MPETVEKPEIVKTPGTVGGKARIAGTRMAVLHIADAHDAGMSVEDMTREYPVTKAEVEAALAYYEANTEEIETERKRSKERLQRAIEEGRVKTLSEFKN